MFDLLDFFKAGGVFMYPILTVFAFGLAVFFERLVFVTLSSHNNRKLNQSLNGTGGDVRDVILESNSIMAQVWRPVFMFSERSGVKKQLVVEAEARYLEAQHLLFRRTSTISMLANIATLLGLLGTIVGLISSFASLAEVSAAEKSVALSSSISIAMNTTAAGLLVAVPLLLMHHFVYSKSLALDNVHEAMNKRIQAVVEE